MLLDLGFSTTLVRVRNVDLCVITQSGAKEYRNYEEHNVRSSDVRERTSVNDSVELNNANISTSTSVTVPVNTE